MGLLHRTLFTNSDKTEIMRYLREYLNHNNPYEHQLTNPETHFQSSILTIPDQIADRMITGSFGENNIATAGNALKVQSIFISDFMTHLSKYLSKTGTEYRFIFYKPSDIVSFIVSAKATSAVIDQPDDTNAFENVVDDFVNNAIRSGGIDTIRNPFNIFYTLYLQIQIKNPAIIADLDKIYGKQTTIGEDIPDGICIQLLPNIDLRRIEAITALIHKYY